MPGGAPQRPSPLAAPFPTGPAPLWPLYLLRAPLWWVPAQGWEGSPVPPGGGGGVGRGQAGALPDVGKERRGDARRSLASPPAPSPCSRPRGPHPGVDARVSPSRGRARGLGEAGRRWVSIPTRGVGGEPGPPRRSPLSPPSTPRIVPGPAGGRRSRAKGQHAVGARAVPRRAAPCRRGRQAGRKAGRKAALRACWSRLSCCSSCSSRLPVCPCSSRAARAGCTPGGRNQPALPWRGSRAPLFFFFFLLPLAAAPGSGGTPSPRLLSGLPVPSRGWHPLVAPSARG